MTAEIRICTVRDTGEAPQKPIRKTNYILKKVYFVLRYGLCKFKMRILNINLVSGGHPAAVSFFNER